MGQLEVARARPLIGGIGMGLAFTLIAGHVLAQSDGYSRATAGNDSRLNRGSDIRSTPPATRSSHSYRHDLRAPAAAPVNAYRQPAANGGYRYRHVPNLNEPAPDARIPALDSNEAVVPVSHEVATPAARKELVVTEDKSAVASVSAEYQEPAMPPPPDLRNLMIRLACGTGVVLIACVGSLLAAKRWLQKGTLKTTNSGRLKQLDAVALPNRSCLQLFQVDQQRVLVGIDATGLKAVLPLSMPFSDAFDAVTEDVVEQFSKAGERRDRQIVDRRPLSEPV